VAPKFLETCSAISIRSPQGLRLAYRALSTMV
jgi:hypothetical protein